MEYDYQTESDSNSESDSDGFDWFTNEISNPIVGQDSNKPDFWATLAKTNPWEHNNQPEDRPWILYEALKKYQLRREPAVREPIPGIEFFYRLNSKPVNVEALLAQSVGHEMPREQACDDCKQGKGIFTSCVAVPGLANKIPECANCHWHVSWPGRKVCSFVAAPPSFGPKVTITPGMFLKSGDELMGLTAALQEQIERRNEAHVKRDMDAFDLHHAKIQEIVYRKSEILARRR